MKEVRILNFREGPQFDGDKSLATFDVEYSESLYIDLRLMAGKGNARYIAYPCKKRADPTGKITYVKYYQWSKERTQQFDKLILDALKFTPSNSLFHER